MKKTIVAAMLIFSSLLIIRCNDSSTSANSQKDSTSTDTGTHKIVTEGGLKDSLATGATDTTKH
ncbi:MAG: hypothetical protein ABUT20_48375 [Bacteroidota bacterium]